MIRFSLFGIPVEIQPWFWVTGALIGGALHARTGDDMFYTVVFMLVATISILVHEFGHALTGRRLAGGSQKVILWAFGGLAENRGGQFTRYSHFWMIFMGPGAGFILLLATITVICGIFGLTDGFAIVMAGIFNKLFWMPSSEVLEFVNSSNPKWWFVSALLWVNCWWSLINLLPVFPLDGGQIANIWVQPRPRMLMLSTITGAIMAGVGLTVMGSLYVAALFGFLAFRSYKDYQACTPR